MKKNWLILKNYFLYPKIEDYTTSLLMTLFKTELEFVRQSENLILEINLMKIKRKLILLLVRW